MARSALPAQSLARLATGPIAFVYAFAALAVAQGPGTHSTYAGRSDALAVLTVGAGLMLAAAGYATLLARPASRAGVLATVAGLLWFAPFWVGWEGGPPLARTLGMVAAAFTFPVLVHLLLAYPSGRLTSVPARVFVAAVYAESTLVAFGRALFYDPFRDPYCWANCTDNAFLVQALPALANALRSIDLWFAAAASLAVVAMLAWQLVVSTGPSSTAQWPAIPAAVALAAATVGYAVALVRIPLEDPDDAVFRTVAVARCGAALLVAAALAWAILRVRSQRTAVARIVAGLGDETSARPLESALGDALGDPGLTVAYWLPESKRYVDSQGRAVPEPAVTPPRMLTSLVRDGRPVAVVAHTAAIPDLEREIGAAVRLALENELLGVEVQTQLDDLRASRARIVESGDAHRRRLERDLHDGAQQHVVALVFDLRVTGRDAEAEGDHETGSLLAEANGKAQAALEELRELAHGLYPAVLGHVGLAAALRTLAVTAPLPVEFDDVAEARYSAPVEMAAYRVLTEAIDDAAERGASHAAVGVQAEDGWLVVTVTDDGAQAASVPDHLADRVGAIGGRLAASGNTVRAEIPCG